MNLIRYNPERWFDLPFDRLFDELWPRTWTPAGPADAFLPRVDILEEREAVVLSAELPGVSKDEIHVEYENGVLTISGEKKSERKDDEPGFFRSERVYGTFKRSFRVPDTVDADKIGAEYVNGVLKLTLPKRPEAAPKHISIRGENGGVKKIETK